MHNFEVFSHYDMIISMWWLQMLQCLYDKRFISTVANNETKVNLSYSTKLISMQISHFQYSLIQYLWFFLAWLCLILYILSAENGVLMSWQKTWFCCINTSKTIKVYNVYMIVYHATKQLTRHLQEEAKKRLHVYQSRHHNMKQQKHTSGSIKL